MSKKGNIITKQCIACNDDFEVPYYQRKSIVTCSKYCSNRLITLRKLKGIYLQCDMCDKLIYKERTKVKSKNFCSKECDHTYRKTVKSLGSDSKKSTHEKKKYYGENWNKICERVRKEQNYKCYDCGISEKELGKRLSVHHLIPFVTFDSIEQANQRSNLEGLCESCHRKRHSGDFHISKLNPKALGKNAVLKYGETTKRQSNLAKKIVDALLNTDKTLQEISDELQVSYATVRRIYKGERWQQFYNKPPIKTNPRAKANI